ncbi:MAG: M15 family metallopeptidase [Oscillospiraceae bacterium]
MKRRYTKKEMEKIYRRRRIALSFIAVVLVVLLGVGVYGIVKLVTNNKDEKKPNTPENQIEEQSPPNEGENVINGNNDDVDVNKVNAETNEDIDIPNDVDQANLPEEKRLPAAQTASGDWNLILANPDTPLPSDFKVETAIVQGAREVDTRIVDVATKMISDAKNQGIDLLVCSGFRSVEKQQNLFDNSISGYIAQGYSKEDAVRFTKAYYAVPGTSEHHTGLAMDIVTPTYQTLDDEYAQTDAAKWLLDNAYKYGFILRYPKDKEDITKIAFEPWHYRYVGEEHAKIIKEQNLCLEEYIKTI